jgi:uncharacterized delta-60 repeat protein
MRRIPAAIITLLAVALTAGALSPTSAAGIPRAASGPGTLDRSFSKDGLRTDFPDGGAGEALVIDGHDRIVVAGQRHGPGRDVVLARILRGGKLDPTFGKHGRVRLNLGGTDEVADIAIAEKGKIVVVGRSRRGTQSKIVVAMLGSKGALAKRFGSKGKVTLRLGKYQDAGGVAVDGRGRIIVGGTASNGRTSRWVIARLLASGKLDKGFATAGVRRLTPSSSSAHLHDLVLAGTKILVGGYAESALIPRFAVARLGGNGKLDKSFGKDGIRLAQVGTGACIAKGIATAPGGKVLLVGEAVHGSASRWAIARFGPAGRLDKRFGRRGTVLVRMGPTYGTANSVAAQGNRIVVGGSAGREAGSRPAVIRLKPKGGMQGAFGKRGRAIIAAGGPGSAAAISIGAKGKIVLTGRVSLTGGSRLLTARLRG